MAEGFARQLCSQQNHSQVQIFSSGLEASQVRPEAIATMDAVGIDISQQTSDALDTFDPEDFDVVISLCGCGSILPEPWLRRAVFEDWPLDDPVENPEIFPRVRDEIRGRVKTLLLSLRQIQVLASERLA